MEKYSHIIWDWNGTLLDDVSFSIDVINKLLKKRNLPQVMNLEHYHRIFCFPITKYYENAGFNLEKEKFSDIAHEFVSTYYDNCAHLSLQNEANKIIDEISKKNIRQVILSATEKQKLIKQVGGYNIAHYFDELLGLDNVFAASKINIGKEYLSRTNTENTVIIGDTLHDKEVADALGVDCILFSGGHCAKKSLVDDNPIVIDKLSDIFGLI